MNKKLIVFVAIFFLAGCTLNSAKEKNVAIESQAIGSGMETTPSPIETIRPTFTPSVTPTATATFDYHRAFEYSETSPDGEFIADVYDYYYYGFTQCPAIEVSDADHNLLWHITCEFDPAASPHKTLDFVKWSLDGRALSYCRRYHGSGGE